MVDKSDSDEKHLLSEALRVIYTTRFHDTELLPFLRERIASATDSYKPLYVSTLFDTLLGWKWSDAIESEAFATWHHLADAAEPGTTDPLVTEVPALYRLVNSMIANRQAAAKETLHDAGSVDKLTRTELAAKIAEFRKAAREGVAARLASEAAKKPGSLEPWLRIEQSYLDVQLDRNLDDIAARCWNILGEAPPKQDAAAEPAEELSPLQLQQRAFAARTAPAGFCHRDESRGAARRQAGGRRAAAQLHSSGNRARWRRGREVANRRVPIAGRARSARRFGT